MAEIKGKEKETKDKVFLLKARNDAIDQLNRCEADIAEINKALTKKEERYPQLVQASVKMSEAMEIERLQQRLRMLQEERDTLIRMRDSVEEELESLKLFKKSISLSNIRYLLRSHPEVKLGQIEADGNVSTGYTSRLEKPENKTDPPVEYLAAAAKAFNVFIDTLIYAPLEEMTASEKYLLKFIEKVARDTTDEEMIWKRESCKYLNEAVDIDSSAAQHRLLVPDESTLDGYGQYHLAHFESRFFPEKTIEVKPDPFHARMTGTDNMMYIVPVMVFNPSDDNSSDKGAGSFGYELYISDDDEVTPICSTLQAHPAVSAAITKLFSLIQEASAHVRLDKKARSLIDAFMNPGTQQPQESKKTPKVYEYLDDDGELPF